MPLGRYTDEFVANFLESETVSCREVGGVLQLYYTLAFNAGFMT